MKRQQKQVQKKGKGSKTKKMCCFSSSTWRMENGLMTNQH